MCGAAGSRARIIVSVRHSIATQPDTLRRGATQVFDELLVVNGWDVSDGKVRLVDILTLPSAPPEHEFIVRRYTAPEEGPPGKKDRRRSSTKGKGEPTEVSSFTVRVRSVLDKKGKPQLPLSYDKRFEITKLDPPHDELFVGDTLVSINGVKLGGSTKVDSLLSAEEAFYQLGVTRPVPSSRVVVDVPSPLPDEVDVGEEEEAAEAPLSSPHHDCRC